MPNARKSSRVGGVWRGRKALRNTTPDPVKKANFAMLEAAKLAEGVRRSAELAALLSPAAVCSRCGSPIGSATPETPNAKPLCPRAHAMVTEPQPVQKVTLATPTSVTVAAKAPDEKKPDADKLAAAGKAPTAPSPAGPTVAA
jgi:hypothetical protein